eukprot:431909-Prorocentrum_minimum.AAC.1
MRPCEPSAAVDASVCGSFRKRAWNAMRVVTLRAMMRPRGSGARRHPRPLLTDGGFAEPSVVRIYPRFLNLTGPSCEP